MSDLRTRIAAAIKREDDLRVCKLSDADIRFMADAVIAELRQLMVTEADKYIPSYAEVLRDFTDHIIGKKSDDE